MNRILVLGFAMWFSATPVLAQRVCGRLAGGRDHEVHAGVRMALVRDGALVEPFIDSARTDSAGSFCLAASDEWMYSVFVLRDGSRPVRTSTMLLSPGYVRSATLRIDARHNTVTA